MNNFELLIQYITIVLQCVNINSNSMTYCILVTKIYSIFSEYFQTIASVPLNLYEPIIPKLTTYFPLLLQYLRPKHRGPCLLVRCVTPFLHLSPETRSLLQSNYKSRKLEICIFSPRNNEKHTIPRHCASESGVLSRQQTKRLALITVQL